MTRSVKNASGSSLRCIDDNASLAQALSSVNSDFQNIRAASFSDHLAQGSDLHRFTEFEDFMGEALGGDIDFHNDDPRLTVLRPSRALTNPLLNRKDATSADRLHPVHEDSTCSASTPAF
jgi:hypothetical protein